MDQAEKVAFGNDLVRTGWLRIMRNQVGVSLNTLAGWLKSNSHHVSKWETGDVKFVQYRSAVRLVDLCDAHRAANVWLQEENLTWADIEPIVTGAGRLGIAVSTLRRRLNLLGIEAIDFGLMGEWIEKTQVDQCRR